MRKHLKSHFGFTLIEMVAVIIILAIMAATALPKFVNLSQDARLSSINGLGGGLRSAMALAKSQWLANNSGMQPYVSMNGIEVLVVSAGMPGSSVNNLGLPIEGGLGIDLALDSLYGYQSTLLAGGGEAFWPTGVTNSNTCYAIYSIASAAVLVSATAVGCT